MVAGGAVTPLGYQVYHIGGQKAMKKLRRFLTVLLFINFSWGMATGMEPLNFWLVMANGTAVIGLAVDEMEERRWKH